MSESKTLMDFVTAAKSRIKEISVDEIETFVNDGYAVLDVREPGEFSQGSLPGALNIPRGMIEATCDLTYHARRDEMMDRNKPWLVLCATSGRAAMVTDVMQQMGFTKLKNIAGGMGAIKKAGVEVVKPA